MKNKSLFLLISVLPMTFALSACHMENDDNLKLEKRSLRVYDRTEMYSINESHLDTYFIDGDELPYVGVNKFVKSLEGYFKTDRIYNYYNDFANELVLYWFSGVYKYSMTINWAKNTIYVNDLGFFNIQYSNSTTNYSHHLKTSKYTSSNRHGVTFKLDDYGFDIYYYQGVCLMPFHILNTLFNSYLQMQYNGDAYYVTYNNLNEQDEEVFNEIKTSSLNGQIKSKQLAFDNFNHLMFTLDYFYGLKSDKGIENSFMDYISSELYNCLTSTDVDVYNDALLEFIYTDLNELHTRVDSYSFYNDPTDTYDKKSYYGDFWNEFYDTSASLKEQRVNVFGEEGVPDIRYKDNIAILTFPYFVTGEYSEIYENGRISEDAYKYDTYYFLLKYLEEVSKNSDIDSIVIDLSLNGGGNLGALYRSLGFLTDEDIRISSYNTLTGEYTDGYYMVDTNDNYSYKDKDAYSQYNWYVLTGINTFSAANLFASVASNMKIATLIGQKSGGGMCSVLPIELVDGTNIDISSNNTSRYVINEEGHDVYYPIEHGIDVDYSIEYSNYYDDIFLSDFINGLE